MFCCRRRRIASNSSDDMMIQEQAPAELIAAVDAVGTAPQVSTSERLPCPICFETPIDIFSYVEVQTHSWANYDRCDAHGICRSCVQRYVEVKLLDEGTWNVRCPGEGCRYHLLDRDIDMALSESDSRVQAMAAYSKLRNENGGLRLQTLLASALADPDESWIWRECQACPACYVLARREDGCSHLACRCGCHYCFVCGGSLHHEGPEGISCCCEEFHLQAGGRAFLAAWMSLKNDSHPALGACIVDVRDAILAMRAQTPGFLAALQRAERERLALEQARLAEEAAEEWARQQVLLTREFLAIRFACENFQSRLGSAGAIVNEPWLLPADGGVAYEGLLVNSTAEARAEENDEVWEADDEVPVEFQYDDCIGYIDDYASAKSQRRAAHGSRRRLHIETLWISGEKVKAKAPAHPKQQKQDLATAARQDTAEAQRLRRLRRTARTSHLEG